MRDLPAIFPEVYTVFCNGEFSVQMSPSNSFGGNEADKTIENTINRDCKTGGEYIGFSASFPATQRCTFQILGVVVRGGGDNSIQFINFGRVGVKSFKEWRQKIVGWKGG